MHSPQFSGPSRAFAWALLSQTIWLPLLAIDLHDRWQARIRQEQEIAAAAARVRPPADPPAEVASIPSPRANSQGSPASTGLLLGAAGHGLEAASLSLQSAARSLSERMGRLPIAVSSRPSSPTASAASPQPSAVLSLSPLMPPQGGLLSRGFQRSELLGGSLSLADLQKPPMPSLALAEQARWASSADPLAPLPVIWREPMRKALRALPAAGNGSSTGITSARVIHIPTLRVRNSTTVPLAIQSDGSVDILSRADDPAVVEEIRHWSSKQTSRSTSGVTAALVHLEPLPAATASTPAGAVNIPGAAKAIPSEARASLTAPQTTRVPNRTHPTAPASSASLTGSEASWSPAAAPTPAATTAPAPAAVAVEPAPSAPSPPAPEPPPAAAEPTAPAATAAP